MMNKITEAFARIGEAWNGYLDWIADLPEFIGLLTFLATISAIVMITVSLVCLPPLYFLNALSEAKCLESSLPRRYSNICEEYQDGKWVEADLSDTIYRYNGAASREK
ncbi:hypothetical protein LCGC14_2473560 [marine sediment metagenome]|uniref:Uncharacterized protein n=1 Tax=marine sediment metagenome TaxID=412755 RepID=A0A0F9DLR9_9ZZZZ